MTAGDAADPRHRPGTPGFRRLNAAMVCAGLAAFGILYSTQPLLPALSEDFGVGAESAGLSVSAATGAVALAVVPATAVAVRVGPVRAMRAALVVATLLTALGALAPAYGVLVGVRGATGVALAAIVAVAMSHVGTQVHPAGLGAAMGMYVAGNSIGGVTGRLVGSGVVDLAGWRWATVAVALLAAVTTALFWWLLPATVPRAPAPPDAAPAAGTLGLLANPSVLALVAVPFLVMGGFVAVYNYLTYRLQSAPFDLPAALGGLVFLAYLVGTVTSTWAGRLADRHGRAPVLLAGIVVMGAGVALTLPDVLALVVVGVLVLTGGFFAAHATASGWTQVVGGRRPDRASALYVMAYYGGSSVFGALLGLAWESAAWPGVASGVGALVAAALLAAAVVSLRERRSRAR
ncbi:MFS transporter [Nocardioides sp. CFH 31398]|uniref:MFS transporter n=1 Tax=Nocardioides sp. CFH 31398 TaxID=2919579 RepID=UPI001F058FA2|nr:MFS transporter [Nocardioides sp. CFH 31398]MCH1865659.1 MFS transporter [Nocardioides sp. CFH 31398]